MWIDSDDGRAMVEAVSKDLVSQVAPEELDLFDELAEEYYARPKPPSTSTTTSDDPLGFGLPEMMGAVTPAALAVTSAVVSFILGQVIEVTAEKSLEMTVGRKIKAYFRSRKGGTAKAGTTPALSREQLAQIRKLAHQRAVEFGLDTAEADKMANALVGSLALSE